MPIVMIKKHLDIIVDHCRSHYPSEAGGFLGGKGDVILGIFPVKNVANFPFIPAEGSRDKGSFSYAPWDIDTVSSFFDRYDMDLIGFYHSHPTGDAPIPSRQDVETHLYLQQRIMMVISLAGLQNTKIGTYSVIPELKREKLAIVKDNSIEKYINKQFIEMDKKKLAVDYVNRIKELEKKVASILVSRKGP